MNKVCLCNIYFSDKLPIYFPYFLKSLEYNLDIDFLFVSNLKFFVNSKNIKVKEMTLSDFNQHAKEKLNMNINIRKGYKLCDFKPTYGILFDNELKNYEYWGPIDFDIIFGKISKFINPYIDMGMDLISVRTGYLSGFFAVYKNKPLINNLFFKSPDVFKVLTDENDINYFFDECGLETMTRLYSQYGHSFLPNKPLPPPCFSMTHIIEANKNSISIIHQDLVHEFSHLIDNEIYDCLLVTNLGLFSSKTSREYLLVHLINIKANLTFKIDKPNDLSTTIFIGRYLLSNSTFNQDTEIMNKMDLMNTTFRLSNNYYLNETNLVDKLTNQSLDIKDFIPILQIFNKSETNGREIIDNIISDNINLKNHIDTLKCNKYVNHYFLRIWELIYVLSKNNILIKTI